MNTLYFNYVLTVANCQSVSKASQKLNLKQQYLSHVIKTLEQEFDIKIFQRHARGVTPTEDGKIFLEQIKEITAGINKLYLQGQYPSKQTICEKPTLNLYVLPMLQPVNINQIITAYRNLFPLVKINYTETFLTDSIPAILEQPYAISLQLARLPLDSLQSRLPSNLKIIKLSPSKLSILTSKQTAHAQNLSQMTIPELLEKDLLFFAPRGLEESGAYQFLTHYGTPTNIKAVENNMIFMNLLENETYFTVGSSRLAEHNENLAAIPIFDYDELSFYNIAIIRSDTFNSPIIRDFLNIMLNHLGELTI